MSTVAELLVRIGGDSTGLRKEIALCQRQLKRGFGQDALDAADGAATRLGGFAVALGALGVASVKMAADMSASKMAFTQLLGSASKAESMLSDLTTFAANTPFELPGLVDSTKKLLAYGFSAQDVIPIMSSVGDAMSLMGGGEEGIARTVRALGQIQAKGKLSAEEVNQLAENNVSAWKYVAAELGVSIPEAMKLTQAGAVNATTAINGIVKGMQTEFSGGMDKLSKEIPGLLSTLKDNVSQIMRDIGEDITVAFDLKARLQGAVNYLGEFSALVKSSGVKEAISQMIPPEVTAGIFIFAGALAGVASIAIVGFGLSMAALGVPVLAFLGWGAAIGALAYVIWAAWDPMTQFFSELWNSITASAAAAWNWMTTTASDFATGLYKIFNYALSEIRSVNKTTWDWIANEVVYACNGMTSAVGSTVDWIANKFSELNVVETIGNAFMPKGVQQQYEKIGVAAAKASVAAKELQKISSAPAPLITQFKGLTNTPISSPATIAPAGGGAAGSTKVLTEQETAYQKLKAQAAATTAAIEKEWVQTTKTQLEQLDIWDSEQLAKLNESASVNTTFESDKLRVAAVYSSRRQKILEQEAKANRDIYRSISDGYMAMQQNISLGSKTGSAKDLAGKDFADIDKMKAVSDYFSKISDQFQTGTAAEKETVLKSLDEQGVAYKLNADGRLSFEKATADAATAYIKQAYTDRLNYFSTCQDVQSNITAAYNANNIAQLQAALTAENAVRLNDYTAQKSMMDTYMAASLASHTTMAQVVAGLYGGAFEGLKTAFSGIIQGTMTVGDAFVSLGQSMLKVLADYAAQWLAGQLMMAVFGNAAVATQTAVSAAAAATTAAAWAPAAAMVSLATFGANSAPAMAGIGATVGMSTALAIVPGFASGAITTGPTLGVIGEGHYDEAVIPLNKRTFEKVGLTNNGENVSNHLTLNVNAIDGGSVKKWLTNGGGKLIEKHLSGRVKQFAPVGV